MPIVGPRVLPPPQPYGDHLWFLDTPQRPPAPPDLEEHFYNEKTLKNLKEFWNDFFQWVLGQSKFSFRWTEGGTDRYGVTIRVAFGNYLGLCPVMSGLICEPGDEDAAEIAAMDAWLESWGEWATPAKQCYFFVASDGLAFYVYSNIDESFRPFEGQEPQVSIRAPQGRRACWT